MKKIELVNYPVLSKDLLKRSLFLKLGNQEYYRKNIYSLLNTHFQYMTENRSYQNSINYNCFLEQMDYPSYIEKFTPKQRFNHALEYRAIATIFEESSRSNNLLINAIIDSTKGE